MTCRALPVPADPTADAALLSALRDAAAGVGPLLLPHAEGEDPGLPQDTGRIDGRVLPAGGGIAVGTSGSTGVAKRAVLSPDALAASADATHARLGGPGRWLLALPAHHIAGLQILLRSLRAGHVPAVLPPGSFTPASFVAGVRAMENAGAERLYSSLVPTQLTRVLADDEAVAAARRLDAILVGGSAVRPGLLDRAREVGVPVVVTYGMSETAGGCVYDGRPLDGARVDLDHDSGRIHLSGDMLANGYLLRRPDLDDPFEIHEGRRRFRTDDVGHLDDSGLLRVDGRVDDVIVTGGLKVWPSEVERALAGALPGDADLVVVGIPDTEWGQRVAVAIETRDDDPEFVEALFTHARDVLPPHARPRIVHTLDAIPRRGPGKPDRARVAALLAGRGWDDGGSPTKEG